MKNIILIGCIVGSLIGFASVRGVPIDTIDSPAQAKESDEASVETLFAAANKVTTASMNPASMPAEKQMQLGSVEGITLYDSQKDAIAKLGEPLRVTEDPHIAGLETYHYDRMNIVFTDGIVDFVEIPPGIGSVLIDGIRIPASVEGMKQAFGEPDFEAEDGVGFTRGEAVLKLFIDESNGQLAAIHYFHIASV
ncbi:hypothetical protein [Paenibacillus harenae]|uniref:hypothetical protein n=1 Tax=Paenibacillus harenae TaxID=306543 RepID=UPI00278F7E13|nr:hypothetical protein [Paenibacillus harenae]MDQ0060357.1 hypothetical protein [Paenibacillus harenae]